MTGIRITILISGLALLLSATQAQLTLYSSGPGGAAIRGLTGDTKICPTDFPTGFNIRCTGSETDMTASFYVNGVRTIERRPPFYLAGDKKGLIKQWMDYPETATIFCILSSSTFSAVISFTCEEGRDPEEPQESASPSASPSMGVSASPSASASPVAVIVPEVDPVDPTTDTPTGDDPTAEEEPGTMFFVPTDSSSSTTDRVKVTPRMTFCPSRDLGTEDFTVLCVASTTSPPKRAIFRINSVWVSRDGRVPFYIRGDSRGTPRTWTSYPSDPFTLACSLGGGIRKTVSEVFIDCSEDPDRRRSPEISPTMSYSPDPSASPTAEAGVSPTVSAFASVSPSPSAQTITIPEAGPENAGEGNNIGACVVIDTRNTTLSAGWVEDGDGVTFNKDNESTKLAKAGVSPLYYTFTPPVTSRYGIALDMTTRGLVNYNDVHMRLAPVGLQVRLDTSVQKYNDWIKGYHNLNSRGAKVLSHLVGMPHSVSSGAVLEQGVPYEFGISGRSNQVTVHRILLFGCEEGKCERRYWKSSQEACVPGSTTYSPQPRT